MMKTEKPSDLRDLLFNLLLAATSVLFGSVVARIVAKILVFQKGLNLFPSGAIDGIQLFSRQFADSKSYDIVEFLLFILVSLGLFGLSYFVYRKNKYSPQKAVLVGMPLVIFAAIFNISTLFAGYSGTQTLVLMAVWYVITVALSRKIPEKISSWADGKFAAANGIIVGFYLSILLHKFTTSVAFPLTVFAVAPFYFYLFSSKYNFLKHPGYILLLISSIFPYNKIFLFGLGAVASVFIFFTRNKIRSGLTKSLESIYPVFVLFIFLYNPMFYLGSFDTVEEGFWAGWLQRMLQGLTMYRDFAIYHPPLLPAGLYIFSRFFGASLYNMRLYFHLLQIAGSIGLYVILMKLVKSTWIKVLVFVLILSYAASLVRNNTEIRVASGLLPLVFIYFYKLRQKRVFLFIAGVMAGLALFVSVETGIASLVALVVTAIWASSGKNYLKNVLIAVSGAGAVILIVFALLYSTQSLGKFLEYVVFYARNFSLGYQNEILGRPAQSTLIQWFDVNGFVGSAGFLWELTKTILIGSAAFALILKIKNKFGAREVLFSGVAVFGIILSRSALGRSDYYHIVFVWITGLLLLGYILDYLSAYSKVVPSVVLALLIFFVGRDITQVSFVQNQLIKLQSYGNPTGSYPSYTNPREGILTGIDIDTKATDDMINFIDEKVGKDEYIYVFPHAPEIYFLSDRKNATSFDSPTIFFTPQYQAQTISELKKQKPRLIVYNPKFSIAGISITTLSGIDNYIKENFVIIDRFGDNMIMGPKE